MKRQHLKFTKYNLNKIVNESINKVLYEMYNDDDDDFEDDDEMTFEEKESYWLNHSVSYERSAAVRMAIDYISQTNPEYYKKIIEVGYNESFE